MKNSFAEFGPNAGLVEELYQLYLSDPSLVGGNWADFFSKQLPGQAPNGTAQVQNGKQHVVAPKVGSNLSGNATQSAGRQDLELAAKIFVLISSYRALGHLRARINPLTKGLLAAPKVHELDPSYLGLTPDDLERSVFCFGFGTQQQQPLKHLLDELQQVYSSSIGFEYEHIRSLEQREWLRQRIESAPRAKFSREQRLTQLEKLIAAEEFENQLHKKYVGQKRFSLQGGETLIAMLEHALEHGVQQGVKEAVIGMAHRGRLNVLSNTVGKPLADIFTEFEDQALYSVLGSGDVKYHKGYTSLRTFAAGSLRVALCPNPSHLEFVNPVTEGAVRARQDLYHHAERGLVLPILLHGDAAFAGQGVVYETINYAAVAGYKTGGTLHVVINNQIGFTTNPEDARSTRYCTDMARGVEIPVFHVNAEDVEAACWVTGLALEFRQKFGRDVIIDLYCYRKYGHNEADDPSFTQPLAYSEIREKQTAATIYAAQLERVGLIEAGYLEQLRAQYIKSFSDAQAATKKTLFGEACSMIGRLRIPTPETGVPLAQLEKVAKTLVSYPTDFTPHPKLKTILEKRVQTLTQGTGIEWGFAEVLAFGSLVLEGRRVRLSGQDCGRGTFSQRHILLNNYEQPERYCPLSALAPEGSTAGFEVHNSTLSEAGIIGFEFGYSAEAKDALVCWEGQFGDFANAGQVAIDQFLASSEAKWDQLCGLVLLLPHGYEGQGPEHSSARLERFLQLAGEGNMVVTYPTSAAQHFHLLRRQGIMQMKRPLVVMTPKSLLRLPEACSTAQELTTGQFQTIIDEKIGSGTSKQLVLLTGKIYYEVKAALEAAGLKGLRLVRVEQLYPFPQYELRKALKDEKFAGVYWVQEEPQNMGAWSYIEPYLRGKLGFEAQYIGRPAAASPSGGSHKRHLVEQQQIVESLLGHVRESERAPLRMVK